MSSACPATFEPYLERVLALAVKLPLSLSAQTRYGGNFTEGDNKMKKSAALILAFGLSSAAQAACFGTPGFQTCTDDSGNSYTVQRFGGSTYMEGRNSTTGSSWSQESHTFGNTTNVYGRDSSGRSWDNTIQTSPGMVQQYGRDASGRSFSRTCTAAGCF